MRVLLALLILLSSCSARIVPIEPPQGPEVSFTSGSGMTFDIFGQFNAGLEAVYSSGQRLNTSTMMLEIPAGFTKFHFRAGYINVKCPHDMNGVEVASTGLFAIHLPYSKTELGQVIKAPVLSCLKYPANGTIPAFTVNLQQVKQALVRESRYIYIQFQEVGDRRDTPSGMEIQISGWLE